MLLGEAPAVDEPEAAGDVAVADDEPDAPLLEPVLAAVLAAVAEPEADAVPFVQETLEGIVAVLESVRSAHWKSSPSPPSKTICGAMGENEL